MRPIARHPMSPISPHLARSRPHLAPSRPISYPSTLQAHALRGGSVAAAAPPGRGRRAHPPRARHGHAPGGGATLLGLGLGLGLGLTLLVRDTGTPLEEVLHC